MGNFEEILKSGGHSNSLGRAEEVLNEVRKDHTKTAELFRCISSDDAWVRMRAVDTFEKLVREKPSLAQPFLPEIFEDLTKSIQPSIQWHIAQMFAEINLNDRQQADSIKWLKDKLKTVEVDWIVSVNAMKTLLQFNQKGLVASSDLGPLFKTQMEHSSPSVRKKAKLFLDQLH